MGERLPLRSLVSIHDVTPGVFGQVEELLSLFFRHSSGPVTLLVVPGFFKDSLSVRKLQALCFRFNIKVAGHGWTHLAQKKKSIYHRLHSLIFSRNCAEHLSLQSGSVYELMQRNANWFRDNDFPMPELYVPPAWALGKIRERELHILPFRYIETLNGVYDLQTGSFRRMPLLGFEADSRTRTIWLRSWNRFNFKNAQKNGWLRIAVHPHDLEHNLADDLVRIISGLNMYSDYGQVFSTPED